MRAVITGINGFVGRYLETELLRQHWQPFGISLEPPYNHNIFQGDLLDGASLKSAIDRAQPDVVFHLAGFTSVKESWKNPELAMKVNRDGTGNLFRAIRDAQSRARVLLISTAEVYGTPQFIPITEAHPANPQSPYAISKLAAETIPKQYPDIATIICRSFTHTGPGQSPTFVIPDFAQQIANIEHKKQTELTAGNLDAQRDITNVRDTVKAYILLVERGTPGEMYNVCSNVTYRIGEILDRFIAMATVPIAVRVDQGKMRPSDIPILRGDNTKLQEATGWKPMIPLEQTLRDVLAYWRKQTS